MELSLDLGLVHVSKTVGECLKEVAKVKDFGSKLSKLDDYVNRLEDEQRKIEVFRRELPLCMLLLNDAILKLKEEALRYKELKDRAGVVGERDDGDEEGGKMMMMSKKSWMDSVQLWRAGDSKQLESKSEPKQQRSEEEDDRSTCENPIQQLPSKEGGAFMAFKPIAGCGRKEEKEVVSQATELSLMTPSPPELVLAPIRSSNQQMKVQSSKPQTPPSSSQLQLSKKQRRCWAPELHRHFMTVLDELGGPHVATPKQIRDRMQVEGLTNDEVKSHLQKYRLHIRKHTAPSAGPANGLWAPKYEGNSSNDTAPKPKVLQSSMEGESMGGFSRSSNEDESMEGGGGESHDSSKEATENLAGEGRQAVDIWR